MSVDQLPRQAPRSTDDAKFVEYDAYIDRQIQSTRRAVKAVDIATAVVTLVAAVLAYLLTIALLEHWVLPSGFSVLGRSVLFVALVGGAGWFAYRRLWPLVVHSINPVYAAQTIEHSSPTLKNSLINLLLFRGRRADISDAVFKTLEEQAAQRLTRVPVDAAVDRSQLIRLGYVLLAIVSVTAIYKLISPKDPIISAERVLMPWADIVPASRVQISAVEPGNVTVARGEFLDISAEIRGIGDSDPVVLRYTTADGQALGKPISMKATDGGLRFACRLPDAPDVTGAMGVGQNLSYRIEAGDARSLDYRVIVVPAPSILVDRVDYDYPEYTGYQDRSVEQLGDIRAIEGTRVTVHARANDDIDEAHVDFDADGRRDLTMKLDGAKARAEFVLGLRDDRETPKHSSYVLRFTNREGRTNRNPVKHPIDVVPDYVPEVAILSPQEKTREVRLDETVAIDVEARDPDFALGEVLLKGESTGRPEINEKLLAKEHTGRFTGRYAFTPDEHGLRAGDIVKLWAVANDVRSPEPNSASTDYKYLRIVSPDPNQQPPPDRLAQRDPQRQPGEPKGDEEQQGQNGGQGQNGEPNPQNGEQAGKQNQRGQEAGENQQSQEGRQQGEKNGEPSADGGQQNVSRDPQSNSAESQANGEETNSPDDAAPQEGQSSNQEGEQKQGQQKPGEQNQQGGQQQSGQDQSGEKQPGGESSQGGDPSSTSDQSGEQKQAGAEGGNSSNQSNDQNSNGKQTGAGAAGGERSSDGSQPAGARPDGAKGEQGKGASNQRDSGSKQGGEQNGSPEPSPISSEGDNDAEAFERISEHLEKNGELSDESPSDGEQNQSQEGDEAQAGGEKRSNNRNAQGDKNQSGSQANDAESGGEQQESQETGDEKQPGHENQQREKQPSGDEPGRKPEAGQQPGDQQQGDPKASDAAHPEADAQPKQKQDAAEGTGAETRAGEMPDDAQPSEDAGEEQRSPGGQQTGSKGESGAGDQPKDNQGGPNSDEQTKPSEKWQQKPSGDEKKPDEAEPPSGARGKRESDSQGDQGGDKPGGGEEGGGQKAPREGTGSAGQNQSADEGAGESSERGQGNDSPDAGADAVSNRPTGQPGSETPGEGSTKRESTKPDQQTKSEGRIEEDGSKSEGQNKQPGDAPSADGQQNRDGDSKSGNGEQSQDGDNPSTPGGNQSGSPDGNNAPQPDSAPPKAGEGTVPDGDEANLEYARKQTDLVLENLAEQLKRKKVDKDLLDKLGWTQEELDQFVDRWQQRKQAAKANEPNADAARRELDDALRSLGLRHGQLQQSKVKDDTQRDLSQGYRGAVPLEYQERLRAYNQGVSRSQQDRE